MNHHLTILIPYYQQPLMLKRQIEEWWRYDHKHRDRLTILIIDDGSPMKPAHHVLCDNPLPDLDIRFYRIKDNLPWNTPGVFNLGFQEAPDGWVLLNGIDHVVPAEALDVLMDKPLKAGYAYRPHRLKAVARKSFVEWDKLPFGILLIQRADFWRAGRL